MVIQRYLILLASIVGCMGIVVGTTEFTQKRIKKPSISTLKNDCCEQFGELLKSFPSLLQNIGQLQTIALDVIQGYWESDKLSWSEKASASKLADCSHRMQSLQKKIQALIIEFQQTLQAINS